MTMKERGFKVNLFVLEVRHGVILFFNERTQAEDGWHWGTEDHFLFGPFKSYQAAVKHARRNGGKGLKLVIYTAQNFFALPDPPPHGHLVVTDTEGQLWRRVGERPIDENWWPHET